VDTLLTIFRTGAELGAFGLGLGLFMAIVGTLGGAVVGGFAGWWFIEHYTPDVLSRASDWFWRLGEAGGA